MTLVVNLYGGPGTGKSTSAAWLFAELKMRGRNVELVREVAKEWCWRGRNITEEDQHTILEAQLDRERIYFGQVEALITDAPLPIAAYYARKFCSSRTAESCEARVRRTRSYYTQVQHFDVWLMRTKEYNPAGRYQSEAEAKLVDSEQRPYVEQLIGGSLQNVHTTREALSALAFQLEILIKGGALNEHQS
jgi:AAA domain